VVLVVVKAQEQHHHLQQLVLERLVKATLVVVR
jgi:hypothetical protein